MFILEKVGGHQYPKVTPFVERGLSSQMHPLILNLKPLLYH